MLEDKGVVFTYREYRRSPLSRNEIVEVLGKLQYTPRELIRVKEAKKMDLPEDLHDQARLDAMAEHPTLVQRPILIHQDKAILARPAERILLLLDETSA